MDEQERRQRAVKRVEQLRGFYGHALAYVLVNTLLFIVNFVTTPGAWWFYWPLLGWGIGLAVHAVNVFGVGGFLGDNWQDRKVEELMQRMNDTESR